MNNSLVSIIIPCYNAESFLAETLESILSQTYQQWETIIVDDCSTDKSLSIAGEYANRYSDKIKVVKIPFESSKGASYARNYGLTLANGQYINFADADDLMLPDKLMQQVKVLDEYPNVGWVIGNVTYFEEQKDKERRVLHHSTYRGIAIGINTSPLPFDGFIRDFSSTPCPIATLIRREVLDQIEGWNNQFRMNFTDQVLYAKIVLNFDTYVMSEIVALYRQHENSSTNRGLKSKEFFNNQLKYWNWLDDYVQGYREKLTPDTLLFIQQSKKNAYNILHTPDQLSLSQKIGRKLITIIQKISGLNDIPEYARRLQYRQIEPLSELWGWNRGIPLCIHYVNEFMHEFASDIRGHCLEFQNDDYTSKHGGKQVTMLDILHVDDNNPKATIVTDLTKDNPIPDNTFDCIICTHVLHVIYDLEKVVSELYRILKPGGILLVAVPTVSMCDPTWHELWRFTEEGLRRTLQSSFMPDQIITRSYGNSLTAAGQIRGFATQEYSKAELAFHDLRFCLEVCARAKKLK